MKRPCHCCRRLVAYRRAHIQGGKARRRHLCPHGRLCVAGHSTNGYHANWPTCLDCLNERRAELGLPPVTKTLRR